MNGAKIITCTKWSICAAAQPSRALAKQPTQSNWIYVDRANASIMQMSAACEPSTLDGRLARGHRRRRPLATPRARAPTWRRIQFQFVAARPNQRQPAAAFHLRGAPGGGRRMEEAPLGDHHKRHARAQQANAKNTTRLVFCFARKETRACAPFRRVIDWRPPTVQVGASRSASIKR